MGQICFLVPFDGGRLHLDILLLLPFYCFTFSSEVSTIGTLRLQACAASMSTRGGQPTRRGGRGRSRAHDSR